MRGGDNNMSAMAEMQPQEKLHDLRKNIDAVIQYASSIKNDSRPEYSKGKREIALVYTKLQEAKMWAGKVLEEMGSELPKEYQDKSEGELK